MKYYLPKLELMNVSLHTVCVPGSGAATNTDVCDQGSKPNQNCGGGTSAVKLYNACSAIGNSAIAAWDACSPTGNDAKAKDSTPCSPTGNAAEVIPNGCLGGNGPQA